MKLIYFLRNAMIRFEWTLNNIIAGEIRIIPENAPLIKKMKNIFFCIVYTTPTEYLAAYWPLEYLDIFFWQPTSSSARPALYLDIDRRIEDDIRKPGWLVDRHIIEVQVFLYILITHVQRKIGWLTKMSNNPVPSGHSLMTASFSQLRKII